MNRPALVPELMVTDCAASLAFWCGPCGFRVLYDRPEQGFACIERDGSRVMLDELPKRRAHRWEVAPTAAPFGRNVNFEIAVPDIASVFSALDAVRWPLFQASRHENLPCRRSGRVSAPVPRARSGRLFAPLLAAARRPNGELMAWA